MTNIGPMQNVQYVTQGAVALPSSGQIVGNQIVIPLQQQLQQQQQQQLMNAVMPSLQTQNLIAQQQTTQAVAGNQVIQQIYPQVSSLNQQNAQFVAGGQTSNLAGVAHGYQAIRTPNGQVLLSTNAVPQVLNNAQANQVVQLVMSNGQVLTTTLANLQSMGITTNNNSMQLCQQQYNNVAFTGNPSVAQQPQLVTNAAGQVFVISPQYTSIQSNVIAPNTVAANPSHQLVQIAQQSANPQIANQFVISQTMPPHNPDEQSRHLPAQQQIQMQPMVQTVKAENVTMVTHMEQENKVSVNINTSNESTVTSQQTVSSTTKVSIPESFNGSSQSPSQPLKSPTLKERVSVQSQTSSPTSSNSSTMEAESTTHIIPNKGSYIYASLIHNEFVSIALIL